MNAFANTLKELRTKKGLLQRELAEDLDIHRNTIVHMEKGRIEPSLETLERIADYFIVSVDFLLGRESVSVIKQPERLTESERRVLDEFRVLNINDQMQVIGFATALRGNKEKTEKRKQGNR